MRMRNVLLRHVLLSIVFLSAIAAGIPLLAQKPPATRSSGASQPASATPSSSANSPNGTTTGTSGNTSPGAVAGGRREPCWEQAGISQQTLAQRRSIEQSARSQVEAVCSDSSLTAQQKHEKIRAIRQQTEQQVQGLFTPQQQEALKACQVARRGGQSGAPHTGGGRGPCGEALLAPSPAPTP